MKRRTPPSHRLPALLLLAVLVLLPAAIPVQINRLLHGRVLDAESKAPIPGAVVALQRTAHCIRLGDGFLQALPPRETVADEDGRFTIGGSASAAGCLVSKWEESLAVLAPGYFPALFEEEREGLARQIAPLALVDQQPVELDPWRYLLDFREYRQPLQAPGAVRDGPAWQRALQTIQTASIQPLGPLGVFVTEKPARFDQVATALVEFRRNGRQHLTLIAARDQQRESVHVWTANGTRFALALPPEGRWVAMAAPPPAAFDPRVAADIPRLGYPILASADRLHYMNQMDISMPLLGVTAVDWRAVSAQHGPIRAVVQDIAGYCGRPLCGSMIARPGIVVTLEADGHEFGVYLIDPDRLQGRQRVTLAPIRTYPLTDLLPVGSTVECLTGSLTGFFGGISVLAAHATGRDLYELEWEWIERKPKVTRVLLPRGTLDHQVTACSAGAHALALAFSTGEIRTLEYNLAARQVTPGRNWNGAKAVSLTTEAHPSCFAGLAVETGRAPRLYAVARNEHVYRFALDGTPDQRVRLDVPTTN